MVRESTTAVGDPEDLLAKARVMGGDAATLAGAQELLEDLIRDAPGTRYAREALELLRRFDRADPPWEEPGPELAEWRDRWRAIQGPDDGRLLDFLDGLRSLRAGRDTPAVDLQPLFDDVENDLRRWFDEQVRGMERARTDPGDAELEPRQFAAIVDLADHLADTTHFEVALRSELRRFRDECYGQRLGEIAPEIRRASRDWALDQAWRRMKELDGPPVIFEDEWQALQEAIYAAEARRSEIEDVLEELPAETPGPSSWPDLRRLLEAVREMLGRELEDVPKEWRDRLRSLTERLVAAALRFLEAETREAGKVEDLTTFWKQFSFLRPGQLDARLELRAGWFDEPLKRLAATFAETMRACETPGALDAWVQSFAHDLEGLPPPVREACQLWVLQSESVFAAWRYLQHGERFDLPAAEELALPEMVPDALCDKVELYQAFLEQIDGVSASLEGADARPEEALRIARGILQEVPGHAEARRLEHQARTLELRLELDTALASWDVKAFLCRAKDPGLPAVYRDLRERSGPLDELATQAGRPPFDSTHKAAAWWQAWRAARRQLPAKPPAVLEDALQRQERARRREWRQILEGLLASSLEHGEYRAAAASLVEADAPDLDRYRRELERRERIGRVEQLLEEERWDLAEKQLVDLPGDDKEHRRLDTALALGRGRTAGVVTLARELYHRWNDAVTYRGVEAFTLLGDGLDDAWRHGDAEVLRLLEDVARRAVREEGAGSGARERIGDWLEWLQIERRLATGVTAAALRRLVRYLDAPAARDLGRRCRSLVDRWREEGDAVALAWAWRALDHVKPPLFPEAADPAEILERRSVIAADGVLRRLRERADLNADELGVMEGELREASGAWRDLADYLDLLPHLTDRPRPPARLVEVEERLAGLLRTRCTIAELEQADLRRKGMDSRWSGARRHLVEELERDRGRAEGEVLLARVLLERLESLEPLTQLHFTETQLRRAAQRCASAEPENLDAEGLFAELAGWLNELAGEFENIGHSGSVMWRTVSRDYWREIPAAAGDLGSSPDVDADLRALAARCLELEDDERRWRETLHELDHKEPIVSASGAFDPVRHRDYLDLYPTTQPLSRRVYRLFDRFASGADQRAILERSVGLLPGWIAGYLKEGVP